MGRIMDLLVSRIFFAVIPLFFCACSSTPNSTTSASVDALFYDEHFTHEVEVPEPETLFSLPKDAVRELRRKFERDNITQTQGTSARKWLANYINADDGGFTYRDNFTRVASQTYEDRAGNCLSLVLLTASLANVLDIPVQFQEVDVPPVWDKQGDFYLINGHINIKLNPASSAKSVNFTGNSVLIDFLPERSVRGYSKKRISKQTVIAMFYNNIAAEAMVTKQYDRAYALLKLSLQHQADFLPALNNLAIAYKYTGHGDIAEKVYRHALDIEPEDLNSLYNFAIYLGEQDRLEEWADIHKVLELARINNPYYYYDMAQQAYFDKEYQSALTWYRRALKRADYRHEFYFGLSRTYWATGDHQKAKTNMEKALELSGDDMNRDRYQAKLHAMKTH